MMPETGQEAAAPPATTEAAPAPMSERRQRAAKLPIISSEKFEMEPEQAEYLFDLLKTDHPQAAADIMGKAWCGKSKSDEHHNYDMNTTLQQIAELAPQSYLESMLIAQMIQVSNAAGKCTHLAFAGSNPADHATNAHLAIKLHRTFTAQIEALQRLRGKGGQRVVVEHVTVQAGGQAIVGNIDNGRGGGGGQNG